MSESDEVKDAMSDEELIGGGEPLEVPEGSEEPEAAPVAEPEICAEDDKAQDIEDSASDAVGATSKTDEREDAPEAAPAGPADDRTCMRRRRTMMVAALCLAIFAIALGSQTLSFLVREYPAAGRLAFDGVALEAIITTHDASGEEVPAGDTGEIPLGMVGLDRSVYFKNTGAQALWVRARADFSLTVDGERHDLADLTTFEVNDAAWIEDGGWLYLSEPLEPGETSPALITGLTVDTQGAHDRFGLGTYELDARAGAVQRKHNADSVLDAEGWPE